MYIYIDIHIDVVTQSLSLFLSLALYMLYCTRGHDTRILRSVVEHCERNPGAWPQLIQFETMAAITTTTTTATTTDAAAATTTTTTTTTTVVTNDYQLQ